MSVLNLSSNSVLESFECYMNSLHDFAFLTFFEVCMLGVWWNYYESSSPDCYLSTMSLALWLLFQNNSNIKLVGYNIFNLCEISHWLKRGTKHTFIRVWKPLPSRRVLKQWDWWWYGSKRTISASSGRGRLQLVLELDTRRCSNEDIGPHGEWIVRSPIGWRGKRSILYKGVQTSPL